MTDWVLPDVGERVPRLENLLVEMIGQWITVGVAFAGMELTEYKRKGDNVPIFVLKMPDAALQVGVVVRVAQKTDPQERQPERAGKGEG